MKIKYENVCSIRNAELDLEPGKLIALTGETNQGKSATFYGFVDAFTNSPDFTRWINKQALEENPNAVAKVSLVDDEGNWYQAEAGKNHINFRVNDIKYEKPGRKSIFELINGQIPGLLYDPEDSRLIMNVQGENCGLFPVDRPDTQIFKTYERLLSLSCTEDVLRTIKLDNDELDFKIADATSSIQKSNEQIAKIDNVLNNINENAIHTMLLELDANQDALNRISKVYEDSYKDALYVEACSKISSLRVLEDIDLKRIENLFKLIYNYLEHVKIKKKLSYEPLEETFDTSRLTISLQNLQIAKDLEKDLSTILKEQSKDISILKEINDKLDSIKVCPYCHKPL